MSYMGLYSVPFQLRENPFGETPDTRFFFQAESHRKALTGLVRSIAQRKGFALLTGPSGTGKTLLSRILINSLEEKVNTALIIQPFLESRELLLAIGKDFGLFDPEECGAKSFLELIEELNAFLISEALEMRHSVLIVDDAQSLSASALETLRLLSNLETETDKLLQIVLVGQPELKDVLQRPDLRQLDQRISLHCELQPFTSSETEAYVYHRIQLCGGTNFIRFKLRALMGVHQLSRGIPRLINKYCERIIEAAEEKNVHLIDVAFVRETLRQSFGAESAVSRLFHKMFWRGEARRS